MTIKTMTAAFIAALSLVALASGAVAQSYPDRAVKVVVGYPPGGPVDIIARVVSDRLAEIWGKPVVVENVSGAGPSRCRWRSSKARRNP